MKNGSSVDQDYKLWWLLAQARQAIFRAREKELSTYGLSAMQAVVLFVIQEIGERATPAVVARWLNREPHTVSALISRMEKDGLVTRTKNLRRKNSVRVSITDKGTQVYHQARQREAIHTAMSVLCEEERKQLMTYLEKIRSSGLKQLGLDELDPRLP